MADILETLAELDDEDFEAEFELDETDSDDTMSKARAVEITEAIRSAATVTYVLLAQAHAKQAHRALGYETWADYVKEEFDMSAQRSYQLLNLSNIVNELETVTPEGTEIKITEAQARDIKRELPMVTEKIKAAISDGEAPEDAVDRVIEEVREQKKADDKAVASRQQDSDEADEEARRASLESSADKFLESNGYDADGSNLERSGSDEGEGMSPDDALNLYNFFNLISGVAALPSPEAFIRVLPKSRAAEAAEQLNEAVVWLNQFQILFDSLED